MFWDEIALYPDDLQKLVHYLGPSIDVGPAMTTKILTQNRLMVHQSIYRQLTLDEIADKDRKDILEHFIARGHEK